MVNWIPGTIDSLIKHPMWFAAVLLLGGFFVWGKFVAPTMYQGSQPEKLIELSMTLATLQVQLEAVNAKEAFELRDTAQQWVDSRDPDEAWLKFKNYEQGTWDVLVVNNAYTREFGISVDHLEKGVTGTALYRIQRPELSETELILLAQYQLNDTKASRVRDGCLVFNEWVLPLGTPPVQRKYRKCRMTSGNMLLVYGERYREGDR